MLRMLAVPALAIATLSGGAANAIALTDTTYTQNFDSLASTGTSSVVPAGWSFIEGGANANGTYAAGTGSDNAGNTYSFGSAGSSDRAFGTLRSGNLIPAITASFTNGNATAITALAISYVGEQWRLGTANRGADTLSFSYSINGGAFVALSALDFSSPVTSTVGAKNGNLAANRTALSANLGGLSIASGQSFVLRWNDFDASGADDGLAIDDFAITATVAAPAVVPEPASWALMIAGFGLVGATLRRRGVVRAAA